MSTDNLRAAAIAAIQRTKSRPRALASFVSKLQSNKVLLASLAEPYLNSVADSLVPVEAHVRSAPGTMTPLPQGPVKGVPGTPSESGQHRGVTDVTKHSMPDSAPLGSDHTNATYEAPRQVSEPKPSRRGLGVIDTITRIVKRSIFDTYVLPDGRPLRQVRWRELPGLVERFGDSAKVLTRIMQHANVPVDTGQYVNDVVGENVVTDAIEEVRNDRLAA